MQGTGPAVPPYIKIERIFFMKILVLQYETNDTSVVMPSHLGRDIEIVLPEGVDHIIIEREEIAPRTVYRIYGVDESELQRGMFR
jgi:hypothetical protein